MDQKVTFTFSVAELNSILQGLGKLPLEAGIDLFLRIKTDAEKQLKPNNEPMPIPEQ